MFREEAGKQWGQLRKPREFDNPATASPDMKNLSWDIVRDEFAFDGVFVVDVSAGGAVDSLRPEVVTTEAFCALAISSGHSLPVKSIESAASAASSESAVEEIDRILAEAENMQKANYSRAHQSMRALRVYLARKR